MSRGIAMSRKLFWEDAYVKDFDAKIVSVDGNRATLDQTAFNPRGGGLVSDTGRMGGALVIEVVKENEEPIHIVDHSELLKVGDTVHCALDWERRYKIMKMHTAAHILCAVVNKETGALITGNQINPDESRIDLNLEQFNRDKLSDYVRMANDAVKSAVDVRSYFMKREDAMKVPGLVKLANAAPPSVDMMRIVQIGDIDTQADGGVHVANTSEIGEIVITRAENKGKSNRRIYYKLQ
jgi:misacylated tRNA(Ala) deacylase